MQLRDKASQASRFKAGVTADLGDEVDDEECIHGMNADWCSICTKVDIGTEGGRSRGSYGGDTKQDALTRLCESLGIAPARVGVGSSLPASVFEEAAKRCGVVGSKSMPEIGQAIVEKAGLKWTVACDSRGSMSGGGSTVTYEGLVVLNRAAAVLLSPES